MRGVLQHKQEVVLQWQRQHLWQVQYMLKQKLLSTVIPAATFMSEINHWGFCVLQSYSEPSGEGQV